MTYSFRFLYESQKRPMRFTNTFKSSVIPGQERDMSNTPGDRTVKVYQQDKENWTKQILRERELERNRPRSAAPFKNVDPDFKARSKSFVNILSTGDG
jgi:hypothetical protein